MDVYDAINTRWSVRTFTGEDVPQNVVLRIIEAACRAPSAGNIQPWRFVITRNPGIKRKLAAAALGQSFINEAPVVVVVCADLDACASGYGSRGENLYAIQDTAAATQNILLCVTAEGYGACWVGAFHERMASEALNLPSRIRPLAIVPIGKPAGKPRKTGRYPPDRVIIYTD